MPKPRRKTTAQKTISRNRNDLRTTEGYRVVATQVQVAPHQAHLPAHLQTKFETIALDERQHVQRISRSVGAVRTIDVDAIRFLASTNAATSDAELRSAWFLVILAALRYGTPKSGEEILRKRFGVTKSIEPVKGTDGRTSLQRVEKFDANAIRPWQELL